MINGILSPDMLYMTQSDLRSYTSMIHGLFSVDRMVNIVRFPDNHPGMYFIRDGHHLAIALIAKFGFIPKNRFILEDSTVAHYMEYNPEAGWYTPFNPFIEQRIPDVSIYKSYMKKNWGGTTDFKEKDGKNVYLEYGWWYLNKSNQPLSVKHFLKRYQYES